MDPILILAIPIAFIAYVIREIIGIIVIDKRQNDYYRRIQELNYMAGIHLRATLHSMYGPEFPDMVVVPKLINYITEYANGRGWRDISEDTIRSIAYASIWKARHGS